MILFVKFPIKYLKLSYYSGIVILMIFISKDLEIFMCIKFSNRKAKITKISVLIK